jgi:peptidoglycan/xylan/chitin deacetylase (PgdA/CDA1 family)
MTWATGRGLAVLTYHAFAPRRSLTATEPSWFAETLAALVEAGYHGVDLAGWVARGRPDEPRGFALAFDDGLASVASVAEVVARSNLPATVFVVTDRVGRDNDWPGQPPGVSREPTLDWPALADLTAMGFAVAAHGRSHWPLTACDPAALDEELRGSRDAVEQRLGRACPLLAYPYGISSDLVRRATARHFSAAFGTRLAYARSGDDPFDLARIDAYYLDSPRALDALVHDRWRGRLGLRRTLRTVRSVWRQAG